MTRRRTNRRAGPNPSATQQELRAVERRLTNRMMGHSFKPSMEPTAFVQRPWNSWTFERTNTTTGELEGVGITIANIISQIQSRNGLDSDNKVVLKIQSAAIWCTAAGLIQPDIECKFYELNEKTVLPQQPRSVQRDLGTLNRPAKCGYVFPLADSKEIIFDDESALLVTVATAVAVGSVVTTRIHVLWQFQE